MALYSFPSIDSKYSNLNSYISIKKIKVSSIYVDHFSKSIYYYSIPLFYANQPTIYDDNPYQSPQSSSMYNNTNIS